ncbi:hypothetical protein BJV74DRAFT_847414 [Russula compacta]|nr:hypothetical protein BJV74DRAFT_847414 [Russula compacta]
MCQMWGTSELLAPGFPSQSTLWKRCKLWLRTVPYTYGCTVQYHGHGIRTVKHLCTVLVQLMVWFDAV